MGLAAAEIGLKPDHRLAAASAEPLDDCPQYQSQPFGHMGDAEEHRRVDVFFLALAPINQRQIGRELGVGEARRQNIGMRFANLAPGAQAFRRRFLKPKVASARPRPAVCRKLLVIKGCERSLLASSADGGQEFAHGVQMAQRGARLHFAGEVRGGVARVKGQRNKRS